MEHIRDDGRNVKRINRRMINLNSIELGLVERAAGIMAVPVAELVRTLTVEGSRQIIRAAKLEDV